MEAKLKTDAIEYLKTVLDTSFTQEETSEAIVPDAYPDMQAILDVEGNITLRSKEAGSGRLSLSGAVAVSVVYLPEGENLLRKLEFSIPFTTGCDASEVTDNTKVSLIAKVGNIDARMINSRKVLVRAEILVEARGYEENALHLTTGLEGENQAGLHLRQEQLELRFVSQVREKTFVLSDEVGLPAGKPLVGEILKSRVGLHTEDVKNVGSKLIFKGTALIHVLYTAQNTLELDMFQFRVNFSQIMELEGEGEGAGYEIALMLTNVYIESGGGESGSIAVEMHMVAQAVEKKTRIFPYIADAYSTHFDLEAQRIEQSVESLDQQAELEAEIRESVELPLGVTRVLDTSLTTGRVHWSMEGDKLILRSSVSLSALYMTEEGQPAGFTRRFEARAEMDVPPGRTYSVTARPGTEIQVAPSTKGVEVRLPLVFTVVPTRKTRFTAIEALTWDEEAPRDLSSLPSVVVFHAEGGESLWHLAKRYSSTEALIVGANGISPEDAPYPGQLFIIPKAR